MTEEIPTYCLQTGNIFYNKVDIAKSNGNFNNNKNKKNIYGQLHIPTPER